jgi:hypothetical protein
MKCELCRVEGVREAGGDSTEWTIHPGTEIFNEEKSELFAALDFLIDDAKQETLNPNDPTNQQAVTLTPQDPLIHRP